MPVHPLVVRAQCCSVRREIHLRTPVPAIFCDLLASSALGRLALLEYLDLSCNELAPADAAALAQCLVGLSRLSVLHLSECSLGAEGVAALAGALARLPCLSILNLSRNGLGPSFKPVLCRRGC